MKLRKITITSILFLALLVSSYAPMVIVKAQDGPPEQYEVFLDVNGVGHNLTENYFDIITTNNDAWEVEDPSMNVNNMTTWINNSWNIKWIKEGNFEMMFLAFMNKSGADSPDDIYVTPAQFWAMHYSLNGHEILIGNLLTAWFGYEDENHNRYYDEGENINPFMMMSSYTDEIKTDLGIDLVPTVSYEPLERTVSGDIITYTWSINYTNQMFFLPEKNDTDDDFKRFSYDDPGSYLNGSFGAGVFDFVYYKYTLNIDTVKGESTLSNDYIQGDLSILKIFDKDTGIWELTVPGDSDYMPKDWNYCIGNWAMIMKDTDDDYEMLNTDGSEVNASTAVGGLTTVETKVSGLHAFDFGFAQKPTYNLTELGNDTNTTTEDAVYATVDIEGNENFLDLVSGMTSLIGSMAQLFITYMINQTNNYVNGISFEDAWDAFDPSSTAALFITCYPEYGEYKGGLLNHDPTFVAYFGTSSSGISGYSSVIVFASVILGLVVISKNKKIIQK